MENHSMLKAVLKKIVNSKRRKHVRWTVQNDLLCKIASPDSSDASTVFPCDVSAGGTSFITKNELKIGEELLIHFWLDGKSFGPFECRVCSQDVYYFGPERDLANSMYRFSVQFRDALAQPDVKHIQKKIAA